MSDGPSGYPTDGPQFISFDQPPQEDGPRPKRRRWRWLVAAVAPAAILVLTHFLLTYESGFYVSRIEGIDDGERKALSKAFLEKTTRLIRDIQNSHVWKADFEEDQINAWLAEDFELNHAQHSLPVGVRDPRVAMDGEHMRVGFRYSKGPVSMIVQISFRAWVPKPNVLAVELSDAWAGAIPLPTNQTRQMIETVAHANDLQVTWKRNGQNLVALLDFSHGQREVLLQQVMIRPRGIVLRGANTRYLPNGDRPDYAPSAN